MKPKELADWLGVSGVTIRTYASDFAEYLSPKAQGGDGRHRIYTDQDARILGLIYTLKVEGLGKDDIRATLISLQEEDWADLPPMPAAPPGAGPVRMVPAHSADTAIHTMRASMMREITILEGQIEGLQSTLDTSLEKNETLQVQLLARTAELGELRGRLESLQGERQLWLRGLLAVAVVAAVLLAIVLLLALTGAPG